MNTTPAFKYHNTLVDGKETVPGIPLYINSEKPQIVFKTLAELYPPEKRNSIQIADLGPLEGGHAVELARMGFDVTLIEAREENVVKLLWLKEAAKLDRFVVFTDDVKNLDKYGKFPVIHCAGLLYHLDNPVSFLKLMAEHVEDILILSTHYAQKNDFQYDFVPALNKVKKALWKRIPFLFRKRHFGLSGLQIHEGFEGRWYTEYNTKEQRDVIANKLLLSAFSNDRSFWLTKEAIIRILEESGFTVDLAHDDPNQALGLFICKWRK